MVIGVSKGDSEEDSESLEKLENDYLDEAFTAMHRKDPAGFRRAMAGAFKVCIERKVKESSLKDDEEY